MSEEPSEGFDAGTVIAQTPQPDARVLLGSSVDLVVSSGPAAVTVPNVVGMTVEKAEEELNRVGLELGTITTEMRSDLDPGIVISQRPEPDSVVARGTEVDLVVSEEQVVD